MRRWVWLVIGSVLVLGVGAWLLLAPPKGGAPVEGTGSAEVILPSGLQAELQEMLRDEAGQGLVYRFRFVAPAFVAGGDTEILMADLEHLCTEFALPKLADTGPVPGQIIISLADKRSQFGQFDPSVTQVFEAYRVEGGACIWEMF